MNSTTSWKANDFSDDKLTSPTDDASSHKEVDTQHDIEKDGNQQEDTEANGQTLKKVKSSASRKADIDPFGGEPPDGGLNAWLKVVGCFLLYSNIWYAHIHQVYEFMKMAIDNRPGASL
jgi:hypothetical protein